MFKGNNLNILIFKFQRYQCSIFKLLRQWMLDNNLNNKNTPKGRNIIRS
jgi:hypothetical protein